MDENWKFNEKKLFLFKFLKMKEVFNIKNKKKI